MSEPRLKTETLNKSSRELVFDEIYRLKLERHVLELEEKGYTVVPDAIDKDMIEKLREVIASRINSGTQPRKTSSTKGNPAITKRSVMKPQSTKATTWLLVSADIQEPMDKKPPAINQLPM